MNLIIKASIKHKIKNTLVIFIILLLSLSFQRVSAHPLEAPLSDPPTINPPGLLDQSGTEGVLLTPYSFSAGDIFLDTDGDGYSITSVQAFLREAGANKLLPDWLNFAEIPSGSGVYNFSGTPPQGSAGVYTIRVIAFDGPDSAYDDFTYTIADDNHAPTVSTPLSDQTLNDNDIFSFSFAENAFEDQDGDALAYTAKQSNGDALPSWLDFNQTTRTFSGTVPNGLDTVLTIRVTATDPFDAYVEDDFDLTIIDINYAPTLDNLIPDQEASEDLFFSYQFPVNTFSDKDGDTLTYSALLSDDSPLSTTWVEFNAATRTFFGTPRNEDVGELNIRVSATDGYETVSDEFKIIVLNVNDVPVLSAALVDQTTDEDQLFTFQVPEGTFTDVDQGDTLTLSAHLGDDSALSTTGWLSFSVDTFSGTPLNEHVGQYTVIVTADDGHGGSVEDTFLITVNNVNDAPQAGTISDLPLSDNETFSHTFSTSTFTDPDGDTLTLTADLSDGNPLPSWLVFSAATRTFSGTAPNGLTQTYTVRVTATDDGTPQLDVSTTFAVTVTDDNDDPQVDQGIPDQNTNEDELFSYGVPADAFTDLDGDVLTYTAELTNGDALDTTGWLSFDGTTFSGTPLNEHVGFYNVRVYAADSGGEATAAETTFTITVQNVNDAPVVSNPISTQNASEDSSFEFTVPSDTFTDVDGDVLTCSAQWEQSTDNWVSVGTTPTVTLWVAFDPVTCTFSGTPDNEDVFPEDTWSMRVSVTDPQDASASSAFDIVVANTNDAPEVILALNDLSTQEDTPFNISVTASTHFRDVDGDELGYTAVQMPGETSLPTWFIFSYASGDLSFSGTPPQDYAGSFTVRITANDGELTAYDDFDFSVTNVNDSPVVDQAISNQSANEDESFSFEIPADAFDDPDLPYDNLEELSYQVTQANDSPLPGWLNFNTETLILSGTPTNDDVGTLSLKVTVSDRLGLSVFQTFNLVVNNVNDNPVVDQGIPNQETNEDELFSFNIPADAFEDIDGDVLTYTAELVSGSALDTTGWLSFDGTAFSGTPLNEHVGVYNVRVYAADSGGQATAAQTTFTITVLNVNDAPEVVNPIDTQNATEDSSFTFMVPSDTFTDAEGDAMTCSAQWEQSTDNWTAVGTTPTTALWVAFDPSTCTFSGTPENDDVFPQDTWSMRVIMTDIHGASGSDDFNIVVANTNDAPEVILALNDLSTVEETAFDLSVSASTHFRDVDGDELSYTAVQMPGETSLPTWFVFADNSGTLSFTGTPPLNYAGSFTVRITASDGELTAYDDFDFSVTNVNDSPVVNQAIADQTATEDVLFSFEIPADAFDDPDLPYDLSEELSYQVTQADDNPLPGWLTFNSETLVLSGTPTNSEVGSLSLKVTVSDRLGVSVFQTFNLTINNANDTPLVANEIADQDATEDSEFTYIIPGNTFTDDDSIHGDTLTLTVTLADDSPIDPTGLEEDPFWLDFEQSTGTLSGTPANADAVTGSYDIKVTATDSSGASVSETFTINVANVNDAPAVDQGISNQNTNEDALFTFSIPANAFSDIDPDLVTDPETGDSWTYSAVESGQSTLPAWLGLSGDEFSGTPDNSQVGSYVIAVTITDSGAQTATTSFTITVNNVNDTPVAGTLPSVPQAYEDSLYTFNINQSLFDDDDLIHGDSLTYTALQSNNTALPSWLTFTVDNDTSLLVFSGTPLMANIGSLAVKVIATDTQNEKVEVPFTIVVNAVNDAPLVANAIQDRSTSEDNVFSYQVPSNTFSDEENNMLTYSAFKVINPGQPGESVVALPAWLSFNTSTRIFSGTPTNDDVEILTIRVQVVDNGTPNESAYDDFILTIINTNDAPRLENAVPDQSVDEDDTASYCIPANTFSDDDGDTLTYQIKTASESDPPAWITVELESVDCSGMPKLSFAPLNADVGTVYLKIMVSDGNGGANSDLFGVTAVNTNDAPYLANAISDFNHDEDEVLDYTFPSNTFLDDDLIHGDVLTYTAEKVVSPGEIGEYTEALPGWITLSGRTFSGTADWDEVEDLTIRLTATDSQGVSASTDFTISLQLVNDLPQSTGAIPNQSATEDIAFSFDLDDVPQGTFAWSDEEDDLALLELTLSADLADDSALPGWLNFDALTHVFSGTALNDDSNQTHEVRVTATDSDGGSASTTFELQVIFVNDPPQQVRSIPDKTAVEDLIFSYQIPAAAATAIFTDEEKDTLTYSAVLSNGDSLPTWLDFTPSSRLFSGTPANADVGSYEIEVTATDPDLRAVSDIFVITVSNSNDKPVLNLSPSNQSFQENEAFSYTIPANTFTDPDVGDILTYTATLVDGSALPAWLDYDSGTRTFTVTADTAVVGEYYIQITASDNGTPSMSENCVFRITVQDIPETISVENPIINQTTLEDHEYQFTVPTNTFLHGDGYAMTYTAELVAVNGSALDPFVTLTTSTAGTWLRARTDNVDTIYIYGTPGNSYVGFYTIRVTAADAYGNDNYDEYELEVQNVNDRPIVSSPVGNQMATEDVAFSLDVSNLFAEIDPGDTYVIDTISVSGIGSYPIDHVTPGETAIDLGAGEYFWLRYNNNYNSTGELVFYGTPENDDVYDSQNGRYTITLTAKDTFDVTYSYSFVLTITPVNDAPTLGSAISDSTVTCGYDLYKLISDESWVDVDEDDTFTFTATIDGSAVMPSWLDFDSSTAYFHGTPTSSNLEEACGAAVAEGTVTPYAMLVTVTDSGGEQIVLDAFTFNVRKPTSGSGSLMYITTDDSYFGDLIIYEDCVDLNGDPDPNCSYDLPLDAFQNFTRTTTEDPWVRDDSLLDYTVATVGGGLPSWVTPDGAGGTDTESPYDDPLHLTFSPSDNDPGVYYLYFRATNPESDVRDNVKKVTVINTNDAPFVLDGLSNRSATEAYAFEYIFPNTAFDDIDWGDHLTYSAQLVESGSPLAFPDGFWLSFNANTRTFSGIPTNADVTRNTVNSSIIYDGDPLTVRVTATDDAGASVSADFQIVVNNNQNYPFVDSTVLSGFSSMTVLESDASWSFTLPEDVCDDVDLIYNDELRYNTVELLDGSALSTSGWLTYDSGTRTFDGTPEYENVGSFFVRVYCHDLTNRSANFYFTITVENVNDHPVVANPIPDTPKNAYEDTFFYYQVPENTFSDEEDNDLLYSAYLISGGTPVSLPEWLAFDSSTRFFSSEDTDTQDPPANEDVGLYQIRLCAVEDLPVEENPGTVCEDFYIQVNNVNDIPLVDENYKLPDQNTDEDAFYSFQINSDGDHPTFYDIDIGDSLSFSATLADGSALPAWLSISGDTLSGTPVNEDVGVYYVKVIATDLSGVQTSDIYVLQVNNVNDAPTVANPISDKTATEDQLFSYTVPLVNATNGVFEDIDNAVYPAETHTFYACGGTAACACDGSSSLFSWLSFSDRVLSGTPNYTEEGHYNVSITVCDAENAYASDSFDLQVVLANDTPLVANPISDQHTNEDSPFTFQFAADVFSDEEGETLTYEAFQQGSASLPAWLSFDADTRTFSSIVDRPDYMDLGTVNIVVRATDPHAAYVEDVFALTVDPVNDTPQLNQTVSDRTVYEEATDSYQIAYNTFVDEENDTLTYALTLLNGDPLPSWISFDPVTRIVEASPLNEHADQTYALLLTVTDNGTPNRSNTTTFNIITVDVNDAPVVNDPIDDKEIVEDVETHYIIPDGSESDPAVFYDQDNGDVLSYTATLSNDEALPDWVQFLPDEREFVFTPTNDHVGESNAILIKVTAQDVSGASASDIFKVTVSNVNDAPIRDLAVDLDDQLADEDSLFSFVIAAGTFYDIDPADSVTYSATLADDSALSTTGWLSFNPTTRTFSGTPLNQHVGTLTVKLIATDQSGAANNSSFDTFELTVNNTNDGPTLAQSVPDQNATEDISFSFTFDEATFADVDIPYGDSLSYTAVENGQALLPGWLSFDNSSRTFSGTPTNDDTRTFTIQLTATDGEENVSTTFDITVAPVNDAPHDISLSANQIDENSAGGTLIGTLSALDVDDTSGFTYSLASGVQDNDLFSISGNSLLSGAPYNYESDTSFSIEVTVSDPGHLTYSETFSITVNDLNETPVLTGESFTLDEGATFNSINLLDNDTDPDPADNLQVNSNTSASHGSLTVNADGSFTYTHDGSETTSDSFTYEVCDDDVSPLCDTAAVSITITPLNDSPQRNGSVSLDDQTAYEDNAFTLTIDAATFTDAEDSSLDYAAVEQGESNLPAWLSFNSSTLQFTGTPAQSDLGVYTILLSAQDDEGVTVTDTFDITVLNTNDAPTLANAIPDRTATEDVSFSYQVPVNTFNDIDPGDSLTYTAVENGQAVLPSWLSFNPSTRIFSGTPANAQVGTWEIQVRVTDTAAASVSDVFVITVNNVNDAPTLDNPIPDQAATEDVLFSYQFPANTFNDIDPGDSLTYTAVESGQSDLPDWLSFNAGTRTFSGTPDNSQVGTWTITVTAEDGSGIRVNDSFDIVVSNVNDAPYVANAISDRSAVEDLAFSFTFPLNTFADIDVGDSLSYSAVESGESDLPGWLSFDPTTRTFSGTPVQSDLGTYTIVLTATDLSAATANETFDILVSNSNDAPTLANPVPDQNATEDILFTYQFPANTFNDVDPVDSLTYSAVESGQSDLPDWLALDGDTRTFSGTPRNSDVGTWTITLTAEDQAGAQVSDEFDIVVANVNNAPYVDNPIPDQTATEDQLFTFQFANDAFDDIDPGDSLTFSAVESGESTLPTWLAFDPSTRTFSGTPANDQVGTWSITVTATDLSGVTAEDTFEIQVNNVNDGPVVDAGIPDQTAYEDQEFSYAIPANAFADVDAGDSLTYEISGEGTLAAWLCYESATQSLCGTPLNAHVGSNLVHVTARDSQGATVSTSFTLTVQPVNDPPVVDTPVITLIPDYDRQAPEDQPFSLDIEVDAIFSDEESDPLTLTATLSSGDPLPAWLSFTLTADPNVYTFSGTPQNADVGTLNILITANDGHGGEVSDTIVIEVLNVNDAPVAVNMTVSAHEKVNQLISLNVTDIDPTGDTLTCTVETLPGGGYLYFSPDGSNPGSRITLSDLPALVENCRVVYYTQVDFSSDVAGYDHFQFSAFDGSLHSLSNGQVTINIINSNNPPTDILLSNNSIPENNSLNQLVGTFTAEDFDLSEVHTFSLVSGEGSTHNYQFSINASGELRAAAVFNYESENEKSIRVKVTDSEGATYSEIFTIRVQDVNEIVESVTLSNNTVVEGQDADQLVGHLDIIDPDANDSWTVTITHIDGTPASAFSPVPFVIAWQNGEPFLTANISFSSSAKSQYVLSMDFTDRGGLTRTQAFTIYVYRMGAAMIEDDTAETEMGSSILISLLENDHFSEAELQQHGEDAGWYISNIVVPPLHGRVILPPVTSLGGKTLSDIVLESPAAGGLQDGDPSRGLITYIPDANYVGTDQFVYLACDNSFYCDYGVVNITISDPGLDAEDLPESIPASGFAPQRLTELSQKPEDYILQSYGLQLLIPKLDLNTRILGVPFEDGDWDITWLGSNAGYLQGSAFPTTSGNTVLTGHVWNADGSEGVFLGLEKLSYGDRVIIQNEGLEYVYEVVQVRQYLHPENIREIFQHEELDWLTLFTCQRFNQKSGEYDYRIMVRAVLVAVNQQ